VNPGRGFDPRLRPVPGRRDPGQRRIIAIAGVVALFWGRTIMDLVPAIRMA